MSALVVDGLTVAFGRFRALDALSLGGLGAIASTTLAALLSVYAAPDSGKA